MKYVKNLIKNIIITLFSKAYSPLKDVLKGEITIIIITGDNNTYIS